MEGRRFPTADRAALTVAQLCLFGPQGLTPRPGRKPELGHAVPRITPLCQPPPRAALGIQQTAPLHQLLRSPFHKLQCSVATPLAVLQTAMLCQRPQELL
ncbi:hypothetical protein UY3_00160 [Chelonia mydas]|uniref:Uncharacterized protein n=1 Tax=Chelonia mydas TaxID=8469 RepID=M7BZA0_CHEMY|nr:hypothetical protein UY3_00160 [Chelonia mydas]